MKSFLIALSTLTLFPTAPDKWSEKELKNSVAFYPVVGLLLGGLLILVTKLPLAHDLTALLLLLAWVIATGAFHLDGLSDCLDGFFGGHNPEERRRIMKDSAAGVYGVTGIGLALLFKYVLLNHFPAGNEAWKWFLLIPMAARWGVTLACLLFKAPPGNQGLGSQVMGLPPSWFAASTLLVLSVGVALLKIQGLEALLLAGLIALGFGFYSQSRIKGLTGDGMGATIELTEIGLLFLACLAVTHGFLQL